MTKEDVENWFDTLGACTGKGEISESKEKLTAYLMQTKGFTTVVTIMTDNAVKALLKIAGSVNKKVPEMKEKYLTVNGARKQKRK